MKSILGNKNIKSLNIDFNGEVIKNELFETFLDTFKHNVNYITDIIQYSDFEYIQSFLEKQKIYSNQHTLLLNDDEIVFYLIIDKDESNQYYLINFLILESPLNELISAFLNDEFFDNDLALSLTTSNNIVDGKELSGKITTPKNVIEEQKKLTTTKDNSQKKFK